METKEGKGSQEERAIVSFRMLPFVLLVVTLVHIPERYLRNAKDLSLWLMLIWSVFTIQAMISSGNVKQFRNPLLVTVILAVSALAYEAMH